jgi:hypothetical protein
MMQTGKAGDLKVLIAPQVEVVEKNVPLEA